MKQHYTQKHRHLLHFCNVDPKCKSYFLDQMRLEKHVQTHNKDRIQCSYCPKTFIDKGHFEFHVDDKHPEKSNRALKFKCLVPDCGAAFSRPRLLLYHERRHKVKKPRKLTWSKCPICQATFIDLRLHIRKKHLDQVTPGDEADQILKRPLKQNPIRKRSARIPTPCDVCGKVLRGCTALRIHKERIHEKIRHKCPQCEKTYTSIGDMRGHVRAVHEGLTLSCRFCSIIFLRGSQRNQHERQTHAEELHKLG